MNVTQDQNTESEKELGVQDDTKALDRVTLKYYKTDNKLSDKTSVDVQTRLTV